MLAPVAVGNLDCLTEAETAQMHLRFERHDLSSVAVGELFDAC